MCVVKGRRTFTLRATHPSVYFGFQTEPTLNKVETNTPSVPANRSKLAYA